jgi:hypothetical protein
MIFGVDMKQGVGLLGIEFHAALAGSEAQVLARISLVNR